MPKVGKKKLLSKRPKKRKKLTLDDWTLSIMGIDQFTFETFGYTFVPGVNCRLLMTLFNFRDINVAQDKPLFLKAKVPFV